MCFGHTLAPTHLWGPFLEAPRAQLCAACLGWVSVGSGGLYLLSRRLATPAPHNAGSLLLRV